MELYKLYKTGTRVGINGTNLEGEAYESVLGVVSVFLDGENECKYFTSKKVDFFDKTINK